MTATEWILVIVLFLCAVFSGAIAGLQLTENGKPVNNLFDPEKDDPKPFFRQSGIVFTLIAVLFAVNGIAVLLHEKRMFYIAGGMAAAIVIYVIASTAKMQK
ncbi:MAG TPA: hypothetical protein DDX71_03840 [Ruminococcus sp.]|nr:hypothetical protein [Ruminococcus sp.]